VAELIFGTASLSAGYGVSRENFNLSLEEAMELIKTARALGIKEFDTAPTYGRSEEILGDTLGRDEEFLVSTKIGFDACQDPEQLKLSIRKSLKLLRVPQIDTLYIHDERNLLSKNSEALIENLESYRTKGTFRKLGASVYSLESIVEITRRFPSIEVFQVPENICDRRLRESEELFELSKRDYKFVVRSVFLQGLLLMKPEQIPSKLKAATRAVESLNQFAKKNAMSALDLCLAYAQSISWCDKILVGAMSPIQLRDISESRFQLPNMWQGEVMKVPHALVDPRKWS
jgi:aryl-alcohol dehydrogenase-like predicted oxidoreductase